MYKSRLTPFRRWMLGMAVACLVTSLFPVTVYSQDERQNPPDNGTITSDLAESYLSGLRDLQLTQLDSPRATLESFQQLQDQLEEGLLAYHNDQTYFNSRRLISIFNQLTELLDQSLLPEASRKKNVIEVYTLLLDIFGRIGLPPLDSVPDGAEGEELPRKWLITGTPIAIIRIDDGPREGEFLFGARTPELAPQFFKRIEHIPLRSKLGIDNWRNTVAQITGPFIPMKLVNDLPWSLKRIWLDTPLWKVLTVVILCIAVALVLILLHRRINAKEVEGRIRPRLRRMLTPLMVLTVTWLLNLFFGSQVNISGEFARIVDFFIVLVNYLAIVWIFWLTVVILLEWIILSPKIPDQSLDANLLRLTARVIALVGAVLILAVGAHKLGLPVLGLIAGLGVGGLAVALAIRPTLENLIAGVILFIDRPVRVGDFCSFGEKMGSVETIGLRSTQIRALDRTLISIPNAIFVDMEIINWSKCDRMLIQTTIGLRYETEPDQLRYVLVKLREMLHAHPKIDPNTVRVRFSGYQESSLGISIRVYALTQNWNDFFAVKEDVFLRVNEVIAESGTWFALPSQTLYVKRDEGLDLERSDAAMQEVKSWRRSGRFPFPRMAASRIEELAGSIEYPPYGSPDAGTEEKKIVEPQSTKSDLGSEPSQERRTEEKRG